MANNKAREDRQDFWSEIGTLGRREADCQQDTKGGKPTLWTKSNKPRGKMWISRN